MRRIAVHLVLVAAAALLPASLAGAQEREPLQRGQIAVQVEHPSAEPSVHPRETTTSPPQGYVLLRDEFVIQAPATSRNDPIRIHFRVHRSRLQGVDPADLTGFRDRERVPTCRERNPHSPDPCADVHSVTDTEVTLTARTSRTSVWSLGFPRDPDGVERACEGRDLPRAPFTDTGNNAHRSAIDCVVWHRIAQGTTGTTYEPRQQVRRDQMASFVAGTVEAAGVRLPAGDDRFDDTEGNIHERSINRLAAAGIVQGTTATAYSPARAVNRDQMASFLARAFAHVHGEQLPVRESEFTDIAGNIHEENIERVAGAGFARGLTPTTYGPHRPVPRDQMASFLARLLDRFAADGRLAPQD